MPAVAEASSWGTLEHGSLAHSQYGPCVPVASGLALHTEAANAVGPALCQCLVGVVQLLGWGAALYLVGAIATWSCRERGPGTLPASQKAPGFP